MSLAKKFYSVEVTLESNQNTKEQILVLVEAPDGFGALVKPLNYMLARYPIQRVMDQ